MELTEKELMQARHWIDDCTWEDLEDGEAYELSDHVVERIVRNHYAGGIEDFKDACIPRYSPEHDRRQEYQEFAEF